MSVRAEFLRGAAAGAPFLLIAAPFATLFGATAAEAGLDILQTLAMSVAVIAGAAQFTALALLQEQAPVFVALAAALAVNMRMALYSAALAPHLGGARLGMRALLAYLMVDQAFAVAAARFDAEPEMPLSNKIAYYLGCMTPLCPAWYGFSVLGAAAGEAIPDSLSLDFALPVCFIAIVAPMLRSAAHVGAAFVSILAALALAGLPWNLGLLAAALLGMIAGARIETALARRAARA